jgi:hypothetical protein
MDVPRKGFQRKAQRGLVAQQQAQRPQVGQPACGGHAQAEGGLPGSGGRALQQFVHQPSGHHQIRLGQAAMRKAIGSKPE